MLKIQSQILRSYQRRIPNQINFGITDPQFDVAEAVVVVNLDGDSTAPIATCAVSNLNFEAFVVTSTSPPPNGAELRYAVFTPAELPAEP
jgi:hypothetical protein